MAGPFSFVGRRLDEAHVSLNELLGGRESAFFNSRTASSSDSFGQGASESGEGSTGDRVLASENAKARSRRVQGETPDHSDYAESF
jgi:hypothetical protein